MKNSKLIFIFTLLATVLAACAKNNIEPEVKQKPEEQTNWAEWSIPSNLPKNFEDILIGTPCWYAEGSVRIAKMENGKIVIKNRGDLYNGGGNVVFVFDKRGWDSYSLSIAPNSTASPFHQRFDADFSQDYFLECVADSILVFTPDKVSQFKEGDNLSVYLMKPETEEFFKERVLSN